MSETHSIVMAEPSQAALHAALAQWRSEASLWRDECVTWCEEHAGALADLASFERALERFADAGRKHQEALARFQQQLTAQEQALAQLVQGNEEYSYAALKEQQQAVAAKHAEQQAAHERVKRLYLEMMAEIDNLRRVMNA